MSKKFSFFYFVFILALAVIIPNLTIASSDTSSIINLTKNANNHTLNFTSNEQLIPGKSQSESFVINNSNNFSVKLSQITLKNLCIYKHGELLPSTDSAYIEFVNNTHLELKYKNETVFQGSFKNLFVNNTTYIPNKTLLFLSGRGDTFSIDLSMTPEANNETQNIKATFDIIYSFAYANPPKPQIESPTSIPLKTQSNDSSSTEKSVVETQEELKPEDAESPPSKVKEKAPANSEPELNESQESEEEIIIIDEEIPKMGIFFDNYIIICISIILCIIGVYFLFFSNKSKKV